MRAAVLQLLPQLRAFARFLERDAARADDLVQETVLRALAAAGQFAPPDEAAPTDAARAWLFTIQRNIFYEQARRRRRERLVLEAQSAFRPAEAAEISRADVAELQTLLWRLPALQREALVLVGAQGLSHAEAALICDVPQGTLRARLSRGRAALARLVAGDPVGEPEIPGS